MNKIMGTFIVLAVFSLICPALGQADFVYIKNGDKLFGTVQNPAFSVQTPYGQVSIKNALLKSIDYKDGPTDCWTLETINNDRFSGTLLNENIQFIEENGQQRSLGNKAGNSRAQLSNNNHDFYHEKQRPIFRQGFKRRA
jgi:hypothetical protein